MTKKMYHLYYRENREVSQHKEEYEANLLRAYRHLDVCRFNINIARILLPLQVGDELRKNEKNTCSMTQSVV